MTCNNCLRSDIPEHGRSRLSGGSVLTPGLCILPPDVTGICVIGGSFDSHSGSSGTGEKQNHFTPTLV